MSQPRLRRAPIVPVFVLLGLTVGFQPARPAWAKDKPVPVDPNDPTVKLFQFLDEAHGGKLTELYILGDAYTAKDGNNQDAEFQHILLVDYDKARIFGKLNVHVRSVSKLAPEQLKIYTLKQIYDYGVEDTEKFVKTETGQLGRAGDLYVTANGDGPLTSAPVTDESRKHYEFFVSQYVLPAVEKNGDASAALVKHEPH